MLTTRSNGLYPQEVITFLEELNKIYDEIKDLKYCYNDEDVKAYHSILDLTNDLQTELDKYYESRYENDIYALIEKTIQTVEEQTNNIHDTDYLMDHITRIKDKFGVSGMARAVAGLDDTELYVFDETYTRYSNFGSDTVQDIIIGIFENM